MKRSIGGLGLMLAVSVLPWTPVRAAEVELQLFTSNMMGHISVTSDGQLTGVLGAYLTELAAAAGVRFRGVMAPAQRSEREVFQRPDACWAAVVRTPERSGFYSWPATYPPTQVVVATPAESSLSFDELRQRPRQRLVAVPGVTALTLSNHGVPHEMARDFAEALRIVETGLADALAVTYVVLSNGDPSRQFRVIAHYPLQPIGLACNQRMDPAVLTRLNAAAAALIGSPSWRRLEQGNALDAPKP